MKKILGIWRKGPLKSRFSVAQKQMVSEFLVSLKECISSGFAHRPRSLEELKFWKATEFRSFFTLQWMCCSERRTENSTFQQLSNIVRCHSIIIGTN